MITADIESQLYGYLQRRCAETPGVFWHAIGGTTDHVHLGVSIPSNLLISYWIGDLKGACSHYINHQVKPKALQWQEGYGVVSFGKNNLEFVREYINSQKEHHTANKIFDRLERVETEERG